MRMIEKEWFGNLLRRKLSARADVETCVLLPPVRPTYLLCSSSSSANRSLQLRSKDTEICRDQHVTRLSSGSANSGTPPWDWNASNEYPLIYRNKGCSRRSHPLSTPSANHYAQSIECVEREAVLAAPSLQGNSVSWGVLSIPIVVERRPHLANLSYRTLDSCDSHLVGNTILLAQREL